MAMPKPDLEVVFGKAKPGGPPADDSMGPPEEPDEDDAESSEAEDAAIDEMFETKDPEARREAFKNAVRLCSRSY